MMMSSLLMGTNMFLFCGEETRQCLQNKTNKYMASILPESTKKEMETIVILWKQQTQNFCGTRWGLDPGEPGCNLLEKNNIRNKFQIGGKGHDVRNSASPCREIVNWPRVSVRQKFVECGWAGTCWEVDILFTSLLHCRRHWPQSKLADPAIFYTSSSDSHIIFNKLCKILFSLRVTWLVYENRWQLRSCAKLCWLHTVVHIYVR